jgi:hypothetical protein
LVWLLVMLAETLQGTLRQLWLVPVLGDMASRQLGVVTGSLIVLVAAWLSVPWREDRRRGQQLLTGLLWVVLTLLFEITLGLALGYPPSRIAADYSPQHGGWLGFGLAFMGLSPLLAASLCEARAVRCSAPAAQRPGKQSGEQHIACRRQGGGRGDVARQPVTNHYRND